MNDPTTPPVPTPTPAPASSSPIYVGDEPSADSGIGTVVSLAAAGLGALYLLGALVAVFSDGFYGASPLPGGIRGGNEFKFVAIATGIGATASFVSIAALVLDRTSTRYAALAGLASWVIGTAMLTLNGIGILD